MAGDGISMSVQDDGIAVITLAREPANAMGVDFWTAFGAAVESASSDSKVRGIVICSGLKRNVFTAGLDLHLFEHPDFSEKMFVEFWEAVTRALVTLYSTSKVTAAAIKGDCPAGGCIMALCCDLRIITADGRMGLNEVQRGMPVPPNWLELFAMVAGNRRAEVLLQTGRMPKSAQLLEFGMVDAVVEKNDELLPATLKEVGRWLKNPDEGRVTTKQMLRGPFAKRWAAGAKQEALMIWPGISHPKVIAMVKMVLSMSKSKL